MSFRCLRGPDPRRAEIIARPEKFMDSSVGRPYTIKLLIGLSGCARTTGAAMKVSGNNNTCAALATKQAASHMKNGAELWQRRSS